MELDSRMEMLRRHICGRPAYYVERTQRVGGLPALVQFCTHCEQVRAAI